MSSSTTTTSSEVDQPSESQELNEVLALTEQLSVQKQYLEKADSKSRLMAAIIDKLEKKVHTLQQEKRVLKNLLNGAEEAVTERNKSGEKLGKCLVSVQEENDALKVELQQRQRAFSEPETPSPSSKGFSPVIKRSTTIESISNDSYNNNNDESKIPLAASTDSSQKELEEMREKLQHFEKARVLDEKQIKQLKGLRKKEEEVRRKLKMEFKDSKTVFEEERAKLLEKISVLEAHNRSELESHRNLLMENENHKLALANELNNTNSLLEIEREKCQNLRNDSHALSLEMSTLEKDNLSLQNKNQEHLQAIEVLSNSARFQISEFQGKIVSLEKQVSEGEQWRKDYANIKDEYTRARVEIATKAKNMLLLKTETNQLRDELKELKKLKSDELKSKSKELESGNEIKELLIIAQNGNTVLSKQLESVKKECIELHEIVKNQKEVETELKVQLVEEQCKFETALETISKLSAVQIQNEERIAKANHSISSLNVQVSNLKEEIREKEIQINNIKSSFEENQSQPLNQIEELKQSLFEKDQSILFTQIEFQLAKEEKDRLKETLAIREQENQDLTRELNKTNALLEIQSSNVLLLASDFDRMEAKMESTLTHYSKAKSDTLQLEFCFNAKKTQLRRLYEQFDLVQAEVGRLKNEKRTLDNELFKTKETLASTILESKQIKQNQKQREYLLTQELETTKTLLVKETSLTQTLTLELKDIQFRFSNITALEKQSLLFAQQLEEAKKENRKLKDEIADMEEKRLSALKQQQQLKDQLKKSAEKEIYITQQLSHSGNKVNRLVELVTLTESSLSSTQEQLYNTQIKYKNELEAVTQQNAVLEAELNNTKNIVSDLCFILKEQAEQMPADIETVIHASNSTVNNTNNNNTNFWLILALIIFIIITLIYSAAFFFFNCEEEEYNFSGFRYPASGIV